MATLANVAPTLLTLIHCTLHTTHSHTHYTLSYTLHSLCIVHSCTAQCFSPLCTLTTHTVPVCICTSIGFAQDDMHNFAQFSFTGMLSMSTCVQCLTVQWYNVPCAQICMNRADGSLVTLTLLLHFLHPPLLNVYSYLYLYLWQPRYTYTSLTLTLPPLSWTYTHTYTYTYSPSGLPPSSLEPSGSRMGKTFNSWSLNTDQIDYCSTCLLR